MLSSVLENKINQFFSAISSDFIGKRAQMICSDTTVLWLLSWLGIMTMFQMRKYLDLIHRIFWLTSKYLWSDAVTKFNSWSFRYVLIMDSFPSKLQPNLQSLIKDPAQLTKQKASLLNAFEIKSIDCRCWKKTPQVIGLGSYHGQWRVYRESDNFWPARLWQALWQYQIIEYLTFSARLYQIREYYTLHLFKLIFMHSCYCALYASDQVIRSHCTSDVLFIWSILAA